MKDMRTPLIMLAGQGGTDSIADRLLHQPGTAVVEHRMEDHIVVRTITTLINGYRMVAHSPLELAHGCVSCTVRNDLLILLRKLHRRDDVARIVVRLQPWLEPEPICFAINRVPVSVGPGYIDGPAARDIAIHAVVACVDTAEWLSHSLSDETLDDGRTVAQVTVSQVEFADVVVLDHPDPDTLAVTRRLAPAARVTVGSERIELSLANLEPASRRGRSDDAHAPLLAGQPPLDAHGRVQLVEFTARRPFHPHRLHTAVDLLLDGVVRTRGRLWLASAPDRVMWLESAGGGLRVMQAGKWLAAMTSHELSYVEAERRAIGDLIWQPGHGDRHTSMAILVCGAQTGDIMDALSGAVLTDAEWHMPHTWHDYGDPFGDWHIDPCDDMSAPVAGGDRHDDAGSA